MSTFIIDELFNYIYHYTIRTILLQTQSSWWILSNIFDLPSVGWTRLCRQLEPNLAWVLVLRDPFWRLERRRPHSMERGIRVRADLRSLYEYKVPSRWRVAIFTNWAVALYYIYNLLYLFQQIIFYLLQYNLLYHFAWQFHDYIILYKIIFRGT